MDHFNPMQLADNTSISIKKQLSEIEHQETEQHRRCHTRCNVYGLLVVLFIALCSYMVYGIAQITESKSNPETKTSFAPTSTYDTPLIYACPSELAYGSIYPYFFYTGNISVDTGVRSYTFQCIASDNGYLVQQDLVKYPTYENHGASVFQHKCTDLISDTYTESSTSWTIYSFDSLTDDRSDTVQCWALIPPKNDKFTNLVFWQFVWIPSYESTPYLSYDAFDWDYISSNDLSFQIEYNVIHPDYINDWYQEAKTGFDGTFQTGYATSNPYTLSIFQSTEMKISLYSTKYLSGNVHNYYSTNLMGTTTARDIYQHLSNDYVYIPQFSMAIDADKVVGNGDTNNILFHSYTEQYMVYGWPELLSGLGGILSLTLNIFGIIAGICLTANYVGGCIKWKGFAPYPPFIHHDQVRLRRFMNKEMTKD